MAIEIKEYIYIIDDEPAILEIYQELLTAHFKNIPYVSFKTAKDAIKCFDEKKPFLFLADFKMPEMDGLELCAEVRKYNPDIPFVVLTGHADKEMAMAGLNSGVTEIAEKPFGGEIFLNLVKKYVDKKIQLMEVELQETQEITKLFIEEANDLLTDLDKQILLLEEDPIEANVIDILFRKIHSIKGGAGAIAGTALLSALAHEFESLLSLIKKNELRPNQEHINIFLNTYDLLQKLLKIKSEDKQPDDQITAKTQEYITHLKSIGTEKNSEQKAQPTKQEGLKIAADHSQEKAAEDEGVLVSNEKLDSFLKLSGELIMMKNYFYILSTNIDANANVENTSQKLQELSHTLNKITDQLQQQIMSVRKVTLDKAFSKLPRIVRQTSNELKKKIKFQMEGTDLGVDKNIAKALSASMVHMVRNSIDHGIEIPEIRKSKGKVEEGQIKLHATEISGTIFITIEDNGAGINIDKVKEKAIKQGLLDETSAKNIPDEQAFDLIFLPGFSTAEKVSSVSGRGVGMDVVKSSITALGGKIKISSELNIGSKFVLEIPIPKSVMVEQTVLAENGGSMFAIPLKAIDRIIPAKKLTHSDIGNMRVCQYNGFTVPVRSYEELISNKTLISKENLQNKEIVMIHHKHNMLGLVVDKIEQQLEAVVRPFDKVVNEVPGFSGTTVLGNDDIAYIASPEKLIGIAYSKTEEVAV